MTPVHMFLSETQKNALTAIFSKFLRRASRSQKERGPGNGRQNTKGPFEGVVWWPWWDKAGNEGPNILERRPKDGHRADLRAQPDSSRLLWPKAPQRTRTHPSSDLTERRAGRALEILHRGVVTAVRLLTGPRPRSPRREPHAHARGGVPQPPPTRASASPGLGAAARAAGRSAAFRGARAARP